MFHREPRAHNIRNVFEVILDSGCLSLPWFMLADNHTGSLDFSLVVILVRVFICMCVCNAIVG